MELTIHDEIANIREELSNWESRMYWLIVMANCRLAYRENKIISMRIRIITETIDSYRRKLVRLLKEAK